MKCPYIFKIEQQTQTTYAYNDDGAVTVEGSLLNETQTPLDCLEDECAAWQEGRCIRTS